MTIFSPASWARRAAPLCAAALTLALVTACDSRARLSLTPPEVASAAAVPAIAQLAASGAQSIVIPDAQTLPAAIREARDVKLAVGGQLVNVTRTATGALEATLPATARPTLAQDGTLTLLFVLDDQTSRLVRLQTGPTLAFAAEPVAVTPSAPVPAGLAVALAAATDASEDAYAFSWSVAPSADGPWQALNAAGKHVTWTPSAPGTYFVRVEATDKARHLGYTARTTTRAVTVVDADTFFVTDSAASVGRGQTVALSFAAPAGTAHDGESTWYVGPSAQGPWSLVSGAGASRAWIATDVGAYHLRVERPGLAGIDTIVSSRPRVQVVEGSPVVTASRSAANRGDRVDLTLHVPDAGTRLVSWYMALPNAPWAPIPGNGATVKFLPDTPGAYRFRADLTAPDGTIKSFASTEAILNVAETPGLLTTSPSPALMHPGDSIVLALNALGLADSTYHFIWYVSPNPAAAGWTPLPLNTGSDLRKTRLSWSIPLSQPSGNYFVRVDAVEDATGRVYSFTSTAAQVLIALNR